MTSPINYAIDDKDLDDATLWAVIDSAAASLSAASKSHKPLAIKHTIPYQSPKPKFISPLPCPIKSPRYHRISDGEVLQGDSNHLRPQKIARSCITSPTYKSPNTSPMVNHSYRTPTYKSPDTTNSPLPMVKHTPTYLSPDTRTFNVNQFTPPVGSGGKESEFPRHSLAGRFPTVSLFKEYQNAAMAILEKSDYTIISGNPYIKKAGWRKISFYFNVSYEIKDKTIEFDGNRDVQRAEFVVRAHMMGGRFSDGWGSCERREKRFVKPNHDIPSTAETRAKNKACQDLLGVGESINLVQTIHSNNSDEVIIIHCTPLKPSGLLKGSVVTPNITHTTLNCASDRTMQGDGWPLGLQPLNARVGLVRNSDLNGSISSNTLLTASTSAESCSSDLDTESSGSFFHDKTISLGSLIGASSMVGLSRRSTRVRTSETYRDKKQYKPKPWLFSICSKLSTDAVPTNNTPSLGHFLEVERRTANIYKRNQSLISHGTGDFSNTLSNPLSVSGHVDSTNRPSPWMSSDDERSSVGLFEDSANEYRTPLLFSCLRRSFTQ